MSVLTPLINKFKNLEAEMNKAMDVIVRQNEQVIANANRVQLAEGQSANDEPLKREKAGYYPYSPEYTKERKRKGKQTAFVDLNMTGDFQRSIKAKRISQARVQLFSTDYKNKFLPQQYPGVFGLDSERSKLIKEIFSEPLKLSVKQYFGQ